MKMNLNYIQRSSSYHAVNTRRLRNKNPNMMLYSKIIAACPTDSTGTHFVGRKKNFFNAEPYGNGV